MGSIVLSNNDFYSVADVRSVDHEILAIPKLCGGEGLYQLMLESGQGWKVTVNRESAHLGCS